MSRDLTATERFFVKTAINAGGQLVEGYVIGFGEEIVRTYGIAGFLRWSALTWRIRTTLRKDFGQRIEHLISAFGAFWNGCGYCAYGNLLAHNLHVFRDTDEVFPIDEDMLLSLMSESDERVLDRIDEFLLDVDPEAARLIKRQYALKSGAEPENEEDERLLLAVRLYDFINECSIVVEPPAPAFSRLQSNRSLNERYRDARKTEA